MNIRTSDGAVNCSKCEQPVKGSFKIQGQSAGICSDCLMEYAQGLGPDKLVTLDGLTLATK